MPTVFKLADIEKACFGRDAWSIPSLRGEFENSYSHMFGWYEDDKLVGYMCVRVMYEEAQICNIAVLENYRRRGIATALLAETAFCCRARLFACGTRGEHGKYPCGGTLQKVRLRGCGRAQKLLPQISFCNG